MIPIPGKWLCRDCLYFDYGYDIYDNPDYVECGMECETCQSEEAVINVNEFRRNGGDTETSGYSYLWSYFKTLVILIILYTLGVYLWDVPTAAAMLAFWAALGVARLTAESKVRK